MTAAPEEASSLVETDNSTRPGEIDEPQDPDYRPETVAGEEAS